MIKLSMCNFISTELLGESMINTLSFMTFNTILSIGLFIASLIFPLGKILLARTPMSAKHSVELFIQYALFCNVGCLFIAGCMGQVLYGHEIAAVLGWGWSPFQYELAFSELALGILGLISPIFHRDFWLATIIASVTWLIGGSVVHLYYLFGQKNEAILNVSFVVGWNIVIALWLVVLYLISIACRRKESNSSY